MKLFGYLLALVLVTGLSMAKPAHAQVEGNLDQVQQGLDQGLGKIKEGVGDVARSIANTDLQSQQKRDAVTLVVGAAAGLLGGGILATTGLFNIQLLGISAVPIAGALLGVYFANEGYFDDLRQKLP